MSKYCEEDAHLDEEDKRQQGILTNDGVIVDGELVIERQKEPRFKSLTMLQQLEVEQMAKAIMRDYPDIERWWADSIAYYCVKEPEKAKKYAEENEHKLFQSYDTANTHFKDIEKENPHITPVGSFADYNMLQGNVKLEKVKE